LSSTVPQLISRYTSTSLVKIISSLVSWKELGGEVPGVDWRGTTQELERPLG